MTYKIIASPLEIEGSENHRLGDSRHHRRVDFVYFLANPSAGLQQTISWIPLERLAGRFEGGRSRPSVSILMLLSPRRLRL